MQEKIKKSVYNCFLIVFCVQAQKGVEKINDRVYNMLYDIIRSEDAMIYTPATKKAIRLMFDAHQYQVDKSGLPYVFHPFHIAEQMQDEATTIVALLHDIVEDTDYTLEDIRAMGFSDEVCAAIDLMTHRDGVPYMEYVRNIKSNPLAAAVKLADLLHNSDPARLDTLTQQDLARIEKYHKAIQILTEQAQ